MSHFSVLLVMSGGGENQFTTISIPVSEWLCMNLNSSWIASPTYWIMDKLSNSILWTDMSLSVQQAHDIHKSADIWICEFQRPFKLLKVASRGFLKQKLPFKMLQVSFWGLRKPSVASTFCPKLEVHFKVLREAAGRPVQSLWALVSLWTQSVLEGGRSAPWTVVTVNAEPADNVGSLYSTGQAVLEHERSRKEPSPWTFLLLIKYVPWYVSFVASSHRLATHSTFSKEWASCSQGKVQRHVLIYWSIAGLNVTEWKMFENPTYAA